MKYPILIVNIMKMIRPDGCFEIQFQRLRRIAGQEPRPRDGPGDRSEWSGRLQGTCRCSTAVHPFAPRVAVRRVGDESVHRLRGFLAGKAHRFGTARTGNASPRRALGFALRVIPGLEELPTWPVASGSIALTCGHRQNHLRLGPERGLGQHRCTFRESPGPTLRGIFEPPPDGRVMFAGRSRRNDSSPNAACS